MNKKQRENLKTVNILLMHTYDILSRAPDHEQDCLDNIPENLQNSGRYEKSVNAADDPESAIDTIDEAKTTLQDSME